MPALCAVLGYPVSHGQLSIVHRWQDATTSDVYVWLLNGTTVTGGAHLAQGMGPWKVVGPK